MTTRPATLSRPAAQGLSTPEKRNLTLLLVGQTGSVVGTQTTGVALPLLAAGLAGAGSLSISVISAARYIPFLFLSAPAGVLVDRFSPRRLMITADAARLLLLAALPVLCFSGLLTIAGIIVVISCAAAARVVFDMSLGKYVISTFSRDSWLTVNASMDAFGNTGELAGPPVAGAVAGAAGAVWALVLDAFTYAVSVVTLLLLRPPADPRPTVPADPADPVVAVVPVVPPSGRRPSISAAAALIWDNRVLRFLAIGGALQNFGLMALQGISVLYMVSVLHLGSAVTGVVIAGMGVGSAVGAAVAPALARRYRVFRLTVATAPLTVLGPLSLMAGSGSAAVAFPGYVLMGFSISLVNVLARRYRQGAVPVDLFGRLSGLYSTVLMGMLPIGAISGGIISAYAGFPSALWTSTTFFAIAALSLVAALRNS